MAEGDNTYQSYSDEKKAGALAVLAGLGGNVSKTSERLGIPRTTLIEWRDGRVHEDVVGKSTAIKEGMADACERIAMKILLSMDDDEALAGAFINQKSTAFGTLVDKMRLLRGVPT